MSLLSYLTDVKAVVEERVRRFYEESGAPYLYAMWSGGKDSTAVTVAALRAGVPLVAVFIVMPGLTHPDNTVEVLEIWRRLCPGCRVRWVVFRRPGDARWRVRWDGVNTLYIIAGFGRYGTFWDNVRVWGLPTPLERRRGGVRWCHAEHKVRVWADLPPNGWYEGRRARYLMVGVRRSESWYRAKRWPANSPVTVYEANGVVDVALSPIYDLASDDVWLLLKKYGVYDVVKRVYDKWGNAPNCAVCPMRSKAKNRLAFERLPRAYLERVYRILGEQVKRWKPGTFAHDRAREWMEIIEEVLGGKPSNG